MVRDQWLGVSCSAHRNLIGSSCISPKDDQGRNSVDREVRRKPSASFHVSGRSSLPFHLYHTPPYISILTFADYRLVSKQDSFILPLKEYRVVDPDYLGNDGKSRSVPVRSLVFRYFDFSF